MWINVMTNVLLAALIVYGLVMTYKAGEQKGAVEMRNSLIDLIRTNNPNGED